MKLEMWDAPSAAAGLTGAPGAASAHGVADDARGGSDGPRGGADAAHGVADAARGGTDMARGRADAAHGGADGALGVRETPDIETSSANYASRFAGEAGRYLLDMQTRAIRAALAGLRPGRALDVGGGHGQLVDPLRALGWSVTVQGTDEACGRNLRELHGKRDCEFVQGSFEALPFEDESFEVVTAVRLISHLEKWPQALSEMCRVARFAVIIDYPSTRALNALAPLMFGVKKSIEKNTRTYRSFAPAELAQCFAANGFRVTREVKQFALPMGLHRLTGAAAPLRAAEAVLRGVGVTNLIGSPVILRADRGAAR